MPKLQITTDVMLDPTSTTIEIIEPGMRGMPNWTDEARKVADAMATRLMGSGLAVNELGWSRTYSRPQMVG